MLVQHHTILNITITKDTKINPNNSICPAEWRIPTLHDWFSLMKFIGSQEGFEVDTTEEVSSLGYYLKSKTEWSNQKGIDNYGFNIIPSGERSGGFFGESKEATTFWIFNPKTNYTITGFPIPMSECIITYNYTIAMFLDSRRSNHGYSCRCIKN